LGDVGIAWITGSGEVDLGGAGFPRAVEIFQGLVILQLHPHVQTRFSGLRLTFSHIFQRISKVAKSKRPRQPLILQNNRAQRVLQHAHFFVNVIEFLFDGGGVFLILGLFVLVHSEVLEFLL